MDRDGEMRPDQDGAGRASQDGAAQADESGAARAGQDGATPAGQDSGRPAGQGSGTQIIEGFARLSEGTLPRRMGITVTAATAERVTGTMPVEGNIQPYGLLHGGASCVLAESLGSLGAALHAGPGRFAVGIEISATHHRGAKDGEVTAVATLAHGGRTLASYNIVITDAGGRRVCTARLTCLIRDGVPGAPEA
jgi:1,4-dihydroxy-2-naphthoyl-CoA hydrolase